MDLHTHTPRRTWAPRSGGVVRTASGERPSLPGPLARWSRLGLGGLLLMGIVGCGDAVELPPTPAAKDPPTLARERHGLDLAGWLRRAKSTDAIERRTAAWALAEVSEDADAIGEALGVLTGDTDAGVRTAAWESLRRLGFMPPACGERLLEAARRADAEGRAAAALERDLASLDASGLEALLATAKGAAFRVWVLDQLRERVGKESPLRDAAQLAAWLASGDPETARASAGVLLAAGRTDVLATALHAGASSEAGGPLAILRALETPAAGAEVLAPAVVEFLAGTPAEREAALGALGAMGQGAKHALLAYVARHKDAATRRETVALAKLLLAPLR